MTQLLPIPCAASILKWWERIGCTSNPGADTGEELARDAEIYELRAFIDSIKRCKYPKCLSGKAQWELEGQVHNDLLQGKYIFQQNGRDVY